MPSISNNAETGLANGTVITTANSGGGAGTAVTTVTAGTGNTFTFSSAAAHRGSLGMALNFGTTAGGTLAWDLNTTQRTAVRFYVNIPALPTAQEYLANFRNGSANMATIGINSVGKLSVQNAAGAGVSAGNAAATFPVNQWVRVEFAVTKGTTTTNGRIEYAYYLGDSTTPIATYDTGATVNTGTTDVALVRLGRTTTATEARILYYDDIAAQDIATGWIGVPTSNVAPNADLGPTVSNIEPWRTQTINATASTDIDGAITGYELIQTAGPTVTLAGVGPTWSYNSPAAWGGTSLTFQGRVQDNGGLWSPQVTLTHNILGPTDGLCAAGNPTPIQTSVY